MPNWSSGFVQTNGIRIHYHRTGGDKPALVLAHGITDHGMCWRRVAQALEKEYDLIMVDARGHGHSDAPETGYSSKDHAADLAGLIEALMLEKPILIGHSMGASNAAMVNIEYPNLVSRTILEDPVWRLDAVESAQERQARLDGWRKEIVEYRSKTREELIEFVRQRSPTWSEFEYGDWADAKQLVNPNVLEFVSTERSWERGLPKIVCPTLLVTANPDLGALVTPQVSKQILERNENVRVVHVEGAGHNIRREQFQLYMERVKRFLKETSLSQVA